MELLTSSLALSARSPAFPELAHLPTLALKRFVKASPVERFRSEAKLLLDAIDTNARFVGSHRDAAEFAPKDTAEVSAFLRCAPSAPQLAESTHAVPARLSTIAKMAACSAVSVIGRLIG